MNVTWSIFVLYLKKVGLFLKHYGVLIVLGLTLVYCLIFVKNKQDMYNDLLKQMQNQTASHNQEIAALTKSHEDEVKRYAEIEKRYNDTLAKIATEHQQALDALDSDKKKEIKKIITETNGNPQLEATRIAALLNIPLYIPVPSQS